MNKLNEPKRLKTLHDFFKNKPIPNDGKLILNVF